MEGTRFAQRDFIAMQTAGAEDEKERQGDIREDDEKNAPRNGTLRGAHSPDSRDSCPQTEKMGNDGECGELLISSHTAYPRARS